MAETTTPRKADKNALRDRINRSLDAAIEEAGRIGYISAEDNRRHMREVLKRIKQRAKAGEVKP